MSKELKYLESKQQNIPFFWQFVGLAGFSYEILEKLDNMNGRIIDNANFFHIDYLIKITGK